MFSMQLRSPGQPAVLALTLVLLVACCAASSHAPDGSYHPCITCEECPVSTGSICSAAFTQQQRLEPLPLHCLTRLWVTLLTYLPPSCALRSKMPATPIDPSQELHLRQKQECLKTCQPTCPKVPQEVDIVVSGDPCRNSGTAHGPEAALVSVEQEDWAAASCSEYMGASEAA